MHQLSRLTARSTASALLTSVLALVVALLPAPALTAQNPGGEGEIPAERTFTGRAQVTAVDLVIDVRDISGQVPSDLTAADFEVLEDGEVKPVVGVEAFTRGAVGGVRPAARPESPAPPEEEIAPWTWDTVIYFDQVMSGNGSIRRAAQALAAQAGRLTELGTVVVVVADPHPVIVLPETRSARLVEQTLLRIGRETAGRDAVRQVRKVFVDTVRIDHELSGTHQGPVRGGGGPPVRQTSIGRKNLVWSTITQEQGLLSGQQDDLLAWAADYLASGPRSLLLINDGYDLDPRDFYLQGIEDLRMRSELDSLLQTYSPLKRFRELSRVLAAKGWVCVNLALGNLGSGFDTFSAEVSGKGFIGDVAGRGGPDAGGDLPGQLFYRPLDPLKTLAEETGGEVVSGRGGIPDALQRLGERVRLTYQVARLPDGELHRVEVRSRRPGLTVKAPEWSGSPAPQAVSSARARRLLEGGVEKGDLPLVAAVAIDQEDVGVADRSRGTLQARVDLSAFAAAALPPTSTLRVTFAVSFKDQLPFVRHDRIEGQSLAGLESWTYTVPVSLPSQAEKVAVVVEELSSGSWGGALAARVAGPLPEVPEGRHTAAVQRGSGAGTGRASAEVQGYDLPVDLLPEPKALLLVPPSAEMLTGRVRFEVLVTRPDVAKVEFRVDGARVTTAEHAPYEARIDVGELPRPRTVEAVALDAAGGELGRDSVVVNQGAGSFRVRLIEPRNTDRVGPVDVEAEVSLRPDDELDRVEIAWNNELVATLYAPPFRQRVQVPPESPVGYVAVTAYLADGSSAEDVVFMNGPGGDERVDVELVELYTVVEDPTGRPIRGLTKGDFRVWERNQEQEVAAVKDGSDLPLSLGLLLDSSASMADELRDVEIAAIDFLFLTLGEGDQAMLVDFDSKPRLAQPLTGDLDSVARQVVRLRADGYTALCDALVFSLVQMQTVRGRRALVVFSDGVGREERVGYATCLRLAQQVGLPIYAIVLDRDGNEKTRSEKMDKIAEAVGGRTFYVQSLENLGAVYRAIREELRSQYVVTYYPRNAGGEDWRPVEVEVRQPGLSARTVSGYWP